MTPIFSNPRVTSDVFPLAGRYQALKSSPIEPQTLENTLSPKPSKNRLSPRSVIGPPCLAVIFSRRRLYIENRVCESLDLGSISAVNVKLAGFILCVSRNNLRGTPQNYVNSAEIRQFSENSGFRDNFSRDIGHTSKF